MWRPEEWQSPQPDGTEGELHCDIGARDHELFEEGATAMLGAVLPRIEREIRQHTSQVSAQAIIEGDLWKAMLSK